MARLTIAQLTEQLAAERHNHELTLTKLESAQEQLHVANDELSKVIAERDALRDQVAKAAPTKSGAGSAPGHSGNAGYRAYCMRARAVAMDKRVVIKLKSFAEWSRNPSDI